MPGERTAGNSGIGDDDRGRTEACDECRRRARKHRVVTHVARIDRRTIGTELGREHVELALPPREEPDERTMRRIVARERGADAAARAGDEDVQVGARSASRTPTPPASCALAPTARRQFFGRSARAFAISASMTGGIIACVPTLSDAVMNLPSITTSGTDCTR